MAHCQDGILKNALREQPAGDNIRAHSNMPNLQNKTVHFLPNCTNSTETVAQNAGADFWSNFLKPQHSESARVSMQKDLEELQLPPGWQLDLINQDIFDFNLVYCPTAGYYSKARLVFKLQIGEFYPLCPPRLVCLTPVYHPDMDFVGNLNLPILQQMHWNSSQKNLSALMIALDQLFLHPQASDDALNKHAASLLGTRPDRFQKYAQKSIEGDVVGEHVFGCCLNTSTVEDEGQPKPKRRIYKPRKYEKTMEKLDEILYEM